MKRGNVEVICGEGLGKTSLALGKGLSALMEHKRVIIIQFLKGCSPKDEQEILERLEPDFKVFRFEKSNTFFEELSEEEKAEELINIRNGFNFARKVAATGECDVLILDEVLGLVEKGIVSAEEVHELLGEASDTTELIFTGIKLCPEMMDWADDVYQITALKES